MNQLACVLDELQLWSDYITYNSEAVASKIKKIDKSEVLTIEMGIWQNRFVVPKVSNHNEQIPQLDNYIASETKASINKRTVKILRASRVQARPLETLNAVTNVSPGVEWRCHRKIAIVAGQREICKLISQTFWKPSTILTFKKIIIDDSKFEI